MMLINNTYIPAKLAAKSKKNKVIFESKIEKISVKIPQIFIVSFKKRYLFLSLNCIYLIKNKKYLKNIVSSYFTLKKKIVEILFGLTKVFVLSVFLLGLGFKCEQEKNNMLLKLGYSHNIKIKIPNYMKIFLPKENIVLIKSSIKEKLNSFLKLIQNKKFPDLYKNKGFIIKGEILRKKKLKKR